MLSKKHFCFQINQQLAEISAPIQSLFGLQNFFMIRYYKTEDGSRSSSYFFPDTELLKCVLNNIGEINTNAVFGDKSELVVVRDAVQAIANQTLKRRFEKQIAKESEEFGIGFSLAIRRFHDDYTDLFMLMAKEGDYLAPSKLLSSLESLQHAIEYYYDHAGLLLSQSAKHRVNYSAVKEKILSNSVVADVDAFKKSCPLSKVKIDICGREAVLSEKDLAYSQLLLQGYTQRQIAQELCLSARTIESRTESLKNRLDCYSMSQLRLTLRTALLSGGRVG